MAYNRVNEEALWLVLRMYNVSGKPLNSIKSMYVDSPSCLKLKGVRTGI